MANDAIVTKNGVSQGGDGTVSILKYGFRALTKDEAVNLAVWLLLVTETSMDDFNVVYQKEIESQP